MAATPPHREALAEEPGMAEEQKNTASRRNMSRSEEDDSDDSGVIKDVSRRATDSKVSEETRKGSDSVESEVSLNCGGTNTSSEGERKEGDKVKADKPPKKSYLDFIEQKPSAKVDKRSPSSSGSPGKAGLRFGVGDLVWGRAAGSYFHPAVVSQDPHFK